MRFYWIILILAILCVVSSYATYLYLNFRSYHVEKNTVCFPLLPMMNKLQIEFGETLLFLGHTDDSDSLKALIYNSSTGSWTWLSIDNQNIACVLHMGEIGVVNQLDGAS